MLDLTQNGDIPCTYLFESLWNWLIVLFYIIILLNISVQISSEKYNTKKKKRGGAFWRGALFRKNTVILRRRYQWNHHHHMHVTDEHHLQLVNYHLSLCRLKPCTPMVMTEWRRTCGFGPESSGSAPWYDPRLGFSLHGERDRFWKG